MKAEGGCYCGSLRYKIEGDAMWKGFCHCRECQYISGGSPNVAMGVAEAGFSYTKGTPKGFTRSDLDNPVTREFCAECGTHILAKAPALPGAVILKVGTLDEPSAYGEPQMAIFAAERQSFHALPQGVPCFEKGPGSPQVS
jgi:hypothetical protein